MRAMAFAKPGGADVLELMDLPRPTPDDDEVLVQVKACALNHLDIWVRKGLPTKIPMPHIGGCETAGVVAEVGRPGEKSHAGPAGADLAGPVVRPLRLVRPGHRQLLRPIPHCRLPDAGRFRRVHHGAGMRLLADCGGVVVRRVGRGAVDVRDCLEHAAPQGRHQA